MSLKIGMYIGSWPQNIGNAFFDFGSIAIIKSAFPDAEIFPMGGAVHWMFNEGKKNAPGSDFSRNSIEIGQYAKVDLIVFAGMSMCGEFAQNNGKTFIEASKRGVGVLGLGAGSQLYTTEDACEFSAFFNRIGKAAVITRDEDTYNLFKGQIKYIESGIDCAFFLPEYYQPPVLDLPAYDIVNFDALPIPPNLNHEGNLVIHTHHDLWGPLPDRYTNKPNTLVSDIPEDYLTLYSQVQTTFSDRVHACIASLAYGNKARLYSNTPRKSLFKMVGVDNISSQVCSIDTERLYILKQNQISLVRKLVESLFA